MKNYYDIELVDEQVATDTAGDIFTGIGLGLALLSFAGITC